MYTVLTNSPESKYREGRLISTLFTAIAGVLVLHMKSLTRGIKQIPHAEEDTAEPVTVNQNLAHFPSGLHLFRRFPEPLSGYC